ncbi:hypothetical protein EJ04DRAFT_578907 [Polyplosphaeria fusca]|uniref:Heterokaryon incompatibility domain-containing protein n=1 Tax=Polyplosphaeria fusca TaxID=682080 RepID=A0A9P4QVI5_9PLEO|nr:hypothetical protein EJ04DRAFT_578907 [Polyplosphaeria fusca]
MGIDFRRRFWKTEGDIQPDELQDYLDECGKPSRQVQSRQEHLLKGAINTKRINIHVEGAATQQAGSGSTEVGSLLACFWSNNLVDGPCIICNHSFDVTSPPIRTVSLKSSSPLTIAVRNRHVSCMKEQRTPFVPVSHIWDKAIADANRCGKSTIEAEKSLSRILRVFLPIVTARFSESEGNPEIWHDYLSIPQWCLDIQQALLALLPEIFRTAPFCIIHMQDIELDQLNLAANLIAKVAPPSPYGMGLRQPQPKNIETLKQTYSAICAIFNAKWYRRMWVTLEYAYCKRACIYTKDDQIIWSHDLEQYDSFTVLLNGFLRNLDTCIQALGPQAFEMAFRVSPFPLLGLLTDMRKNVQSGQDRKLCFAEAMAFVGGRDCTAPRDRFLAMAGFLQLGQHESNLLEMPKEHADACLWLARQCLKIGDCSPILMLRRGENPHPKAHWLVGHEKMSKSCWDLGPVQYPLPKISIENNNIRLRLAHVGSLERIRIIDFANKEPILAFDSVLSTILEQTTETSPEHVLRTLDRIYFVPEFLRPTNRAKDMEDAIPTTVSLAEVNWLLSMHKRHKHSPSGRLSISKILAHMLSLHDPLAGAANSMTVMSYAGDGHAITDQYHEYLATVQCPGCLLSFVYRITLLKGYQDDLDLFRIPSLSYSSSSPGGVGLVLVNETIVGRMIFGAPACDCVIEGEAKTIAGHVPLHG